MKKRVLALLLVFAMGLSLAACSAPAAEQTADANSGAVTEAPAGSETPEASTTPAVVADLSQDILTFAAGELAEKKDLVVVNGESIPTSLFCYWLAFSCSYFENMYYYYGYTVADFADYIMSDACTMSAYYFLLNQKAAALGCPLTDEQLETIKKDMAVDTEEHTERQIMYGLSHEDLMFIYSVSDLYNNVQKVVVPSVTEEQLNNYVYRVKHILISTQDETGKALEGEALEEKTQKANEILAQLQACEPGAELEELFDTLMNEHSEDGRDAEGNLGAPDGYTAVPGEMVSEFEAASFALQPGEMSGLVKSDFGYHIILRYEVEDPDSYIEGCTGYLMDQVIEQWLSEADIVIDEAALESVDVADFYNRYIAWQTAYIEANGTEE